MVKIFYDAEFTGLWRDTSLISIGMLSESGRTFYAEFTDYDQGQLNDWLKENVIANLTNKGYNGNEVIRSSDNGSVFTLGHRDYVRDELIRWLEWESCYDRMKFIEEKKPWKWEKLQFITDCYAYDWMLLVDLITTGGTAIDMPDYIDYIPIDLSTILWCAGIDPDISREEYAEVNLRSFDKPLTPDLASQSETMFRTDINPPKHNSLFDAKVIRTCFEKTLKNNLSITPFN